jgi:hypothetical protein
MQAKLLLVELKAARGDNDVVFSDGRVARAPRHAVAKDEIEPNLHFPRSAFADCVRTFNANDFNLPPTIAGIIVVQNLSRLEHDASLPVRTLSQQNSTIHYTNSVWVRSGSGIVSSNQRIDRTQSIGARRGNTRERAAVGSLFVKPNGVALVTSIAQSWSGVLPLIRSQH